MSSRPPRCSWSTACISCAGLSPNFDFSPPVCAQRPNPADAQLDADAAVGVDAHLVGGLQQHVDFAHLLDHDEDLVSEALAHEGQPHELLVLVSVADDHVVGALATARARPAAPAWIRIPARRPSLRRTRTISSTTCRCWLTLIGIHRGIAAGVAELLDRRRETCLFTHAMRERRMSEKRSRTGRVTPCSSRSWRVRTDRARAPDDPHRGGRPRGPVALMSKNPAPQPSTL